MTQLQPRGRQEAGSGEQHPAAAALAQDAQGSDTPGASRAGTGAGSPQGRQVKATRLSFKPSGIMCLFPPAAASFSIPPFPQKHEPSAPQVHIWAPREASSKPV